MGDDESGKRIGETTKKGGADVRERGEERERETLVGAKSDATRRLLFVLYVYTVLAEWFYCPMWRPLVPH